MCMLALTWNSVKVLIMYEVQVIFCTGYNITFPAIENGDLLTVDKNVVETFLYMYPLATADHNTLGILGMVEVGETVLFMNAKRVYIQVRIISKALKETPSLRKSVGKAMEKVSV